MACDGCVVSHPGNVSGVSYRAAPHGAPAGGCSNGIDIRCPPNEARGCGVGFGYDRIFVVGVLFRGVPGVSEIPRQAENSMDGDICSNVRLCAALQGTGTSAARGGVCARLDLRQQGGGRWGGVALDPHAESGWTRHALCSGGGGISSGTPPSLAWVFASAGERAVARGFAGSSLRRILLCPALATAGANFGGLRPYYLAGIKLVARWRASFGAGIAVRPIVV